MNAELTPGVRRLVVGVDIEGYSRHLHPEQHALQARLRAVVRAALAQARVGRRHLRQQDSGDGGLLLLPPGVDEGRAVPGLLRGLLVALADDRFTRGHGPALRLRVALGQGVVHEAVAGFVGRAVVEVSRVLDAQAVRDELRAVADADACLVVTDDLYRDVVVQGYGGFPGDGFRQVALRDDAKGFTATAWMRAMSAAALGPDPAVVAAAAAAGSLPLGAGTLVLGRMAEEYLAAHVPVPWDDGDAGPHDPDPHDADLIVADDHPDDPAHDDPAEDDRAEDDPDHDDPGYDDPEYDDDPGHPDDDGIT